MGGAEERLLDVMLQRFRECKLLTTGILGAIRILNRLELVGETLRYALNVLAELSPTWFKTVIQPEWAERYTQPVSDYHLPYTEAERLALAEIIGEDGRYLLNQVAANTAGSELAHIHAVQVLRQVWLQSFYEDEAGRTAGGCSATSLRLKCVLSLPTM